MPPPLRFRSATPPVAYWNCSFQLLKGVIGAAAKGASCARASASNVGDAVVPYAGDSWSSAWASATAAPPTANARTNAEVFIERDDRFFIEGFSCYLCGDAISAPPLRCAIDQMG